MKNLFASVILACCLATACSPPESLEIPTQKIEQAVVYNNPWVGYAVDVYIGRIGTYGRPSSLSGHNLLIFRIHGTQICSYTDLGFSALTGTIAVNGGSLADYMYLSVSVSVDCTNSGAYSTWYDLNGNAQGTAATDYIAFYGGGGDDHMYCHGKSNTGVPANGANWCFGEAGNDSLEAYGSVVFLYAGEGNDTLWGDNYLYQHLLGEGGNDCAEAYNRGNPTDIDGGSGTDNCYAPNGTAINCETSNHCF